HLMHGSDQLRFVDDRGTSQGRGGKGHLGRAGAGQGHCADEADRHDDQGRDGAPADPQRVMVDGHTITIDGRRSATKQPVDATASANPARVYRQSSTETVFAYVAPKMRQYGFVSPPTTTTWMSSRLNIWIISSGAALSLLAHGSSPNVARG